MGILGFASQGDPIVLPMYVPYIIHLVGMEVTWHRRELPRATWKCDRDDARRCATSTIRAGGYGRYSPLCTSHPARPVAVCSFLMRALWPCVCVEVFDYIERLYDSKRIAGRMLQPHALGDSSVRRCSSLIFEMCDSS